MQLLTKEQTAERLSVSTRTVDRLVSDGSLSLYKIRGACRFSEEEVDRFIQGCRQHAAVIALPKVKASQKMRTCAYVPGMKVC